MRENGGKQLISVQAETAASAIRIGSPASWKKAVGVMQATGGAVEQVSEVEIALAKAEIGADGIGCEPASATTVAGIKRLVVDGVIDRGENVVAVLTGHLLKDADYIIKYHQDSLYTHDRAANRSKEERRIAGTFSNAPARVKATRAAILQQLESHDHSQHIEDRSFD